MRRIFCCKWRINLQGMLPLVVVNHSKLQHSAYRFHLNLKVHRSPNLAVTVCVLWQVLKWSMDLANNLALCSDILVFSPRRIVMIASQQYNAEPLARETTPYSSTPVDIDDSLIGDSFVDSDVPMHLIDCTFLALRTNKLLVLDIVPEWIKWLDQRDSIRGSDHSGHYLRSSDVVVVESVQSRCFQKCTSTNCFPRSFLW